MRHFLLAFALLLSIITEAQIDCEIFGNNYTYNWQTIFKLDVDGDGVKDFWFYSLSTSTPYTDYVVAKNGSEVEVDLPNGIEANNLQYQNQIGNNYWNDTAFFQHNNGGNFYGSNYHGYIGIKFFKGGNYYLGWVEIDDRGYQGSVDNWGPGISAGDCSTTAIQDLNPAVSIFIFPNPANTTLNLRTTNTASAIIRLYQSDGKLLSESKQSPNHPIDIRHLSPGVYFAEIRSGEIIQRIKWLKE